MTIKEAKEQGFTHNAKMYGFKGYLSLSENRFQAKYWLADQIVEALIYVEQYIPFNEQGYKILVGSKL